MIAGTNVLATHIPALFIMYSPNSNYLLFLFFGSNKCEPCLLGKSLHLRPSPIVSRSSSPLELLFVDVWGPSPITSSEGYKYFLLLVDDFSKFVRLNQLFNKSDALALFVQF